VTRISEQGTYEDGMLRRVALVRTDVSEELSASFITVTRISEQGTYEDGMLRRVALVRTDVSEELSATFITVTRISELGTYEDGMLRRVALVRTDVSEELSAPFITVTRISELGYNISSNQQPKDTANFVDNSPILVTFRSVRRLLVTASVVPSSHRFLSP
jgi:DNA-binding TFAR19-related protein (PDSD5 family)